MQKSIGSQPGLINKFIVTVDMLMSGSVLTKFYYMCRNETVIVLVYLLVDSRWNFGKLTRVLNYCEIFRMQKTCM